MVTVTAETSLSSSLDDAWVALGRRATYFDFPGIAAHLGFIPCPCGATDGTVGCEHRTASEMMAAAVAFLDDHLGESFEDPGYFAD